MFMLGPTKTEAVNLDLCVLMTTSTYTEVLAQELEYPTWYFIHFLNSNREVITEWKYKDQLERDTAFNRIFHYAYILQSNDKPDANIVAPKYEKINGRFF